MESFSSCWLVGVVESANLNVWNSRKYKIGFSCIVYFNMNCMVIPFRVVRKFLKTCYVFIQLSIGSLLFSCWMVVSQVAH